MQTVIKIYHVVQELKTFSLTGNGRTNGRTHIVIIVQTQGAFNHKTTYFFYFFEDIIKC